MTAARCPHCGGDVAPDLGFSGFCCAGCRAAYALVSGLGLESYYARRCLDPSARSLRPDSAVSADFSAHERESADGTRKLYLMVDGLHCAACVWLIETILARQPGCVAARLNMTTRRLTVVWRPSITSSAQLLEPVLRLGYRLAPFDPARLDEKQAQHERMLLRALAVAGFAAGNIMLFSVSVWAGAVDGMGEATRALLHWFSALIALPAVVYSGQPFFRSAWAALSHRRTNMDVPISLGVILASSMSLAETIRGGPHAYFDAAVSLLFFLLIGRYLESRARGRARAAAEHLLALSATAVTVLDERGVAHCLPPDRVQEKSVVLVAMGERVGIDGTVIDGRSDVDAALISGESVPVAVGPGSRLFAGSVNLTAPLRLEATAVGDATLLAEIVRLMEAAEQGRARYVELADRVARLYAPVVHVAALSTFLWWTLWGGTEWQPALLIAVAVLIVTCPCALALAVPVVQVIASGRLLRRGVLLKSATALERLARVDTIVFDKTGTLTEGRPVLAQDGGWTQADLENAARLAAASHHPLAHALAAAAPHIPPLSDVRELPGAGMEGGGFRLGSRAFLGIAEDARAGSEIWFARQGEKPIRFAFQDQPRSDAKATIAALKAAGYKLAILSGDRLAAVQPVAEALGIDDWRAGCTPADKCARLAEWEADGQITLMAGDGLNDAPALAAAYVSVSPATAADISQVAADAVFQGERLAPLWELLTVARRSESLVRQNFALALLYNLITVPLAVAGYVTPLIAAAAMSSSSVIVIANALRLGRLELAK